MAKRGRKRTKTPETWTPEQLQKIDEMAEAQCKDAHIAETLGVSADTFKREFADRCRQKRAEGKAAVMLAQHKGAKTEGSGGTTERIWWGKQHLDQTDKQDQRLSGEVTILPPQIS